MGENIDDFIRRFGGEEGLSEEKAAEIQQYYQRLSTQLPEVEDYQNPHLREGAVQYLGNLSDDEFRSTSSSAYSKMDQEEQSGVTESLFRALKEAGVDITALTGALGVEKAEATPLKAEEYAQLADYTRKEHPEAMEKVLEEKPMWLKALGHPVVLGALGMLASRWLQKHQRNQ